MNLILCIDNTCGYEEISAKCPYCGYFSDDNYYNLINDQYSDIPMIWCDGCEAHSFFKYPDETTKKQKTEHGYTVSVPLIGVLEIVDTRLTCYKSPRKLSTEEVTSIINSWDNNHDEVVKKFNLSYDPFGNYENCDKSVYLNMSLPVNSYNITKPLIPYPDKINICNDGTYIICKLETGEVVQYNGD